jgi:CubicO group peptidase (beta-lactamase class C family)
MSSLLFERVDSIFESFFSHIKSPGLTYAITRDGAVIHARAWGNRTLSSSAPVSRCTPFRIASMSKSFACAALMQLRDAGKLSLQDSVQQVLPTAELSPTFANSTVHDLISMNLDLPVDDPWADRQLGASNEVFSPFFATPLLQAQDGAGRCCYSNLSYFLLGRIISTLSGKSALQYITDSLLQPLKLTNTFWNPSTMEMDECAVGHRLLEGTWTTEPFIECIGDGAVFGGLWSTLDDLARWLDFLRATSKSGNCYEEILAASSRREMQGCYSWIAPQSFARSEDGTPVTEYPAYGYGLRHYVTEGMHSIAHSGGLPGYGSHMRINLETGIGIVALSNGTYCPVWEPCRSALEYLVRTTFLPGPHLATEASVLSQELARLLQNWDPDLAGALFTDTFWLDYPRELFVRDCREKQELLGSAGHVALVEARAGATAKAVLKGERGAISIMFGVAPLGSRPQIQSLGWA